MPEQNSSTEGLQKPRARWWWRCALLVGLGMACVLAVLIALVINDRWLPLTGEAELQSALTRKLAEAQQVHVGLDDLWARLERGASVDCAAENVARPYFVAWRSRDRQAYPSLAALADSLNGTIRELHRAADAWTAACQGGTGAISTSQAAEARAALDRAADRLRDIATHLE